MKKAGVNFLPFLNFNSIKVRLELICSDLFSHSYTSFQFHKGTIRTIMTSLASSMNSIFQFHKGTIRTKTSVDIVAGAFKFQFHKGTIKTTKPEFAKLLAENFNSIKVRLKQTANRFP